MSLTVVTDYPWQPAMMPVCYLCGAAPRTDAQHPHGEPIINTGKYIEMEGFLHICGKCWEEGAGLLGWRDPDTLAARELEVDHLQTEVARLTEELDSVNKANSVLLSGVLDKVTI